MPDRPMEYAGCASYRWHNILVEVEQVGRIVFGFKRRQSSVIAAVGAAGAVLAFVAQVVDVGRARQMRLPRRKKLARPVDVALRIGRVGPTGQDD